MVAKRPTTVDQYIHAAPHESRAHLTVLRALLRGEAPEAEEVLKWGKPFFVEPRFLFAFSSHKAHVSFAPGWNALDLFRDQIGAYPSTKHFLKIPYNMPVPEHLVRTIARYCVKSLAERTDDGFW